MGYIEKTLVSFGVLAARRSCPTGMAILMVNIIVLLKRDFIPAIHMRKTWRIRLSVHYSNSLEITDGRSS